MPSTVFEILADARQYGRTLDGMVSAGTKVEVSQTRLQSAGIKTTRQYKRELLEIEKLTVALKTDALATAQLARRKEELTREMRGLTGETRRQQQELTKATRGTGTLAGGVRNLALVASSYISLDLVGRIFDLGTAVEETGSKFETVFQDSAGAVDDFGETFFNLAGLTQREGRDITSTLGAIAQGMGVAGNAGRDFFSVLEANRPQFRRTGEAAADFSVFVTTLAGDLASFNNARIDDTLRDIQSGLTGQVEPLRKYGIELDAVTIKQRALQITGKLTEKQLTNEDKLLARLVVAYERAGVQVGDLERTQDSAANGARAFGARIRDLADDFAAKLLPAIDRTITSLSTALDDRESGITKFLDNTAKETSLVLDLFNSFVLAQEQAKQETEEATTVWGKFWDAVFQTDPVELLRRRFDEINKEREKLARDDKLRSLLISTRNPPSTVAPTPTPDPDADPGGTKKKTELDKLLEKQEALRKSARGFASEEERTLRTLRRQNEALKNQLESLEEIERRGVGTRLGDFTLTPGATDAERRREISAGKKAQDREAIAPPSVLRELTDESLDEAARLREGFDAELSTMGDSWREFVFNLSDTSQAIASTGNLVFGQLAGAADNAFKASGESAKGFFGLWKAFAIAQATINTYESATAAYKSLAGIPVVGPALGAAAAVAAVAFGLSQVARIAATEPGGSGGGGAGGGASASAPGLTSAVSNPAAVGVASAPPSGVFDPSGARGDNATRRMEEAAVALAGAVESLRDEGVRIFGESRVAGDDLVTVYDNRKRRRANVGVN